MSRLPACPTLRLSAPPEAPAVGQPGLHVAGHSGRLWTRGALIGAGGEGEVYEVRHPYGARLVMKVNTRPEDGAALLREGEQLTRAARLGIPAVRLYDQGRLPDGRPFLILWRWDQDLHAWAQGTRALPVRLRAARAACEAVAALHARGLVHGDLKPANLLVDGPEDEPFVALADVGGIESIGTRRSRVALSPGYAAPEQWLLSLPAAVENDVFALALTVLECLCGDVDHAPGAAWLTPGGRRLRDLSRLRSYLTPPQQLEYAELSGAPLSDLLRAGPVVPDLSTRVVAALSREDVALESDAGLLAAALTTCLDADPTRRVVGANDLAVSLDGMVGD